MSHISHFLCDLDLESDVGLNNYIARELSPQKSYESMSTNSTPPEEKEKFVWRMNQPSEPKRYQLFPQKDKLSRPSGRDSPDPEKAFALALADSSRGFGFSLKMKAKEQLSKRRKPSVAELGPMTSVQEVSMDSPTIPGRPALHERSNSAPGYHSSRQISRNESPLSRLAEHVPAADVNIRSGCPLANIATRRRSDSPRPFSPRILAPLKIPKSHGTISREQEAENPIRSIFSPSGPPPEVPPKAPFMLKEKPRSPQSAVTTGSETSTRTLDSSPAITSARTPWTPMTSNLSVTSRTAPSAFTTPNTHTRNQSDSSSSTARSVPTHSRNESEQSILDRGRPKKRAVPRRRPSKGTLEREQRIFETLPSGVNTNSVRKMYGVEECDILREQALGQARQFEVLRSRDVEDLSRELRALTERCEYLRQTHSSLRTGRHSLHSRICTYLRSPRTAVFSDGALLKQEEALWELDRSIDDWAEKLERAENRRLRVMGKLLEHVAAAAILPATKRRASDSSSVTSTTARKERDVDADVDDVLILQGTTSETRISNNVDTSAVVVNGPRPDTPPRSPKSARSVEVRPATPTTTTTLCQQCETQRQEAQSSQGHVPKPQTPQMEQESWLNEPDNIILQAPAKSPPQQIQTIQRSLTKLSNNRHSAETVRIYVDHDVSNRHDTVYGLFADVEAEMERMANIKIVDDSQLPLPMRVDAMEVLGNGVYMPYRPGLVFNKKMTTTNDGRVQTDEASNDIHEANEATKKEESPVSKQHDVKIYSLAARMR